MTGSKLSFAAALTLAVTFAMPVHAQAPAAPAAPKPAKQATYATPDEAAAALAAAVRAADLKALLEVVGPSASSWLSSGDKISDRDDWQQFLKLYDAKHAIEPNGTGKATLIVGNDAWPFPAPVVKKGERWRFDANAGREEVLNRRVGRNELDTIQTMLAIVDAQREYATANYDANGYHDYAKRFFSSPGSKDGLYWETKAGERASPLGRLVAEAGSHGYAAAGSTQTPYHGYLFRLLTSQGPDAPGGAYDYLVKDKLIGGFAVLAWPAKYANSGIMTFLVNHDGVVYEKDLGDATATEAAKIKRFNPDKTWKKSKY